MTDVNATNHRRGIGPTGQSRLYRHDGRVYWPITKKTFSEQVHRGSVAVIKGYSVWVVFYRVLWRDRLLKTNLFDKIEIILSPRYWFSSRVRFNKLNWNPLKILHESDRTFDIINVQPCDVTEDHQHPVCLWLWGWIFLLCELNVLYNRYKLLFITKLLPQPITAARLTSLC